MPEITIRRAASVIAMRLRGSPPVYDPENDHLHMWCPKETQIDGKFWRCVECGAETGPRSRG